MGDGLSFFPRHPFHLMSDASSSSSHSEVGEALCFQALRALKKVLVISKSDNSKSHFDERKVPKCVCVCFCACVCLPGGKQKQRSAPASSPAPRAQPQAAHIRRVVSKIHDAQALKISLHLLQHNIVYLLSIYFFACACKIQDKNKIFLPFLFEDPMCEMLPDSGFLSW